MLVEACVETVDSGVDAERSGAGRLELCASLGDAGTTPSTGMILAVKEQVGIPVVVIIRPRGGGFVYSDIELDVMIRDIRAAREAGADGVAIGVLTRDARVDVERTAALVHEANGLPVVCHRAFDMTRSLDESLENLIECGVSRVLTSGGARTALEGAEIIAGLRTRAAGRITIMAGGGIREESVAEVVRRTGVSEIHVRGASVVTTDMAGGNLRIRLRKPLPEDESAWEETDGSRIAALVREAGKGG